MITVAVGGTFNILHIGHKALLKKAFELGDLIHIGLTTDEFANQSRTSDVKPFEERRKALLDYLNSCMYGKKFTVVPLHDAYGMTIEKDLDHLVVSPETLKVADKINYIRDQEGRPKIKIVIVDHVLAEDGKPVSSTRVANREITADGRIRSVFTRESYPKEMLKNECWESGKGSLLMHICCAPCLAPPLPDLKEEYCTVGFFYNPNIQPFSEYRRRLEAVKGFTEEKGLRVIYRDEYNPEHFIRNAVDSGMEHGKRCMACYRDRLVSTVEEAKELGVDRFSSTLLSSPYQIHEVIAELGKEIADDHGLTFHEYEVREDYGEGVKEVREMGLHVQNYCGCIFSERDRFCRSLIHE